MKLRWWILGTVAVLVVALILGTPRLMFNFVFGRPSRSTKVPSYYVDTPHYKASQAGLAKIRSMEAQELTLTSRDGLKLHAYLLPAEKESKKFVIGVHGYRSYSRPECAPFFEFYHDLGYNMLMVDDRAHAPSEGDYIGFGVLDRLDCVDWAKKLVADYGADTEILLHGVSMGAATVLAATGEADLPAQVKGVVSDCGFSRAWDVLHFQLKESMHLPADWILPRMEKLCEKKAGFNFHDYAAVDQVKKAKVPILFVHGEKDQMVPFSMVHELYEACASDKRLLTVPEAAHGESIAFAPEEYHRAIREHFGI